jgi:hypothetical protein
VGWSGSGLLSNSQEDVMPTTSMTATISNVNDLIFLILGSYIVFIDAAKLIFFVEKF